jgi:hypothetical protein
MNTVKQIIILYVANGHVRAAVSGSDPSVTCRSKNECFGGAVRVNHIVNFTQEQILKISKSVLNMKDITLYGIR